ncbi:hypothetical protein KFL_001390020 [Klebsormidium nitens]|uniref:Uncharacterized protein n=1 Tax=Klebsormidium nitens TaxID=105231 RepID=A0A1Y1HX00_KLENI|nr:hypothetical protein KFL_001390020 [Klebsormidium nitens]|eukprot:GAQ83184.1 hypothetical protein KFL_001390020 [Klebsormidium nitens]
MALKAEQPVNLIAVLQSVTLHAKDTLQEVYLSLDFSEKEAKNIDWKRVLVMLQECKELVVLHIFLWESRWHSPAVILNRLGLTKPFANLRDLSLFGFAIPNTEIASFFESFSSLKTLELHHLEGQDYELSSVIEAVAWGSQIVGLGVKSTVVPRSLELVVGLLDSKSSDVSEKALDMLAELLYEGNSEEEIKVAIGRVPGCLQKLVGLLEKQEESAQGGLALIILDNLAMQRQNCIPIASCPRSLQWLLAFFGSECKTVRWTAASTLGSLADEYRVNELAVQLAPAILQGLVNLLDDERCFEGLVNLLGSSSIATREKAAWALSTLAEDSRSAESITAVPGFWQKAVKCLDPKEGAGSEWTQDMQEDVIILLRYVKAEAGVMEAIASIPGSLQEAPLKWLTVKQIVQQVNRTSVISWSTLRPAISSESLAVNKWL